MEETQTVAKSFPFKEAKEGVEDPLTVFMMLLLATMVSAVGMLLIHPMAGWAGLLVVVLFGAYYHLKEKSRESVINDLSEEREKMKTIAALMIRHVNFLYRTYFNLDLENNYFWDLNTSELAAIESGYQQLMELWPNSEVVQLLKKFQETHRSAKKEENLNVLRKIEHELGYLADGRRGYVRESSGFC